MRASRSSSTPIFVCTRDSLCARCWRVCSIHVSIPIGTPCSSSSYLIKALLLKLPNPPTFLLKGRKIDMPMLDYSEFWKPLDVGLKAW